MRRFFYFFNTRIFLKHCILQNCLHTMLLFKAIEELYQSFRPGPRRLAQFKDSWISASGMESVSSPDSSTDSSLLLLSSWRTSCSSFFYSTFSSPLSSTAIVANFSKKSAVVCLFLAPSSGRVIGPRRYVAPFTASSNSAR